MGRRSAVIGTLVAASWLALAWAGTATSGDKEGKPVSDAQFVHKASASDLAEITLGQIGMKQGQSAEVKQFAQQMVTDHTMSSKELLAIAGKKGLAPATQMDEKHKALVGKLLALKGAEFDRAYMEHMVIDHKEAVALFQGEANNGKDADLKAFAAKTLPVIQKHLKMAQELSGRVGSGK